MNCKRANNLILIEAGRISVYKLDNKNIWELGRPSGSNIPDIKLHTPTVSRKHGKFLNMDGVWFYVDYYGKNGTIFNHNQIGKGLNGRIKPILLKDGDTFVFGGGETETINAKTVWGMFSEKDFEEEWRTVDSKGMTLLRFITEDEQVSLTDPGKGTVIEKDNGMAIYMGDLTYTIGNMKVVGT